MIIPTVGRVVWFWDGRGLSSQPEAAMVTYVHGERWVNLVVHSHDGGSRGEAMVSLLQDDDETPRGRYAQWMPYQVKAAEKDALQSGRVTDLEAELDRNAGKA